MLSDDELWGLFKRAGLEKFFVSRSSLECEYERRIQDFARAIESAATAPLLARIAELEAENYKLAAALNYWKDRCASAVQRPDGESS